MIELETTYHGGRKTFIYLFIAYSWWLTLAGIGSLYFTYAINFGYLHEQAVAYLAAQPDLYLDVSTVSEWFIIAGLGFLLVAYLRAAVMYRKHKFFVDNHAFHMRTGLFRIREFSAPFQQISNVHIDQPYHWRLLGIAEIEIITSSNRSEGNDGEKSRKFLIPYIDKSLAKELSHFLTRRAAGDGYEDIYADEFEEYEDDEEDDVPQVSNR